MPKIDITSIEGYETMTAEEKVAALEGFEYTDNTAEAERYKNALSKANTEAADWKKKYNASLGEEEQRKQENEERIKQMSTELETLKREKTISAYQTSLVSQGYASELAAETAVALADGDMDKVFANQSKFLEAHDKTFKAKLLGDTPTPPAGKTENNGDFEQRLATARKSGNTAEAVAIKREAAAEGIFLI
jgi:hypothetical protein